MVALLFMESPMLDPRLPIQDTNYEDMSLSVLAETVFKNPKCELVLKSILNKMLFADWEGTQEIINEAVINHAIIDEDSTLLDIKLKEI